MAVLDKLPGLEFYFEVNGERLEEYDDEEEVEIKPGPVGEYQSSRTVTKYIEAVTGAAFGIKCHISSGFKMNSPNLCIRVCADGNYIEGKVAGPYYIGSTFTFHGAPIFYPMSRGSAERHARQNYRFFELDICKFSHYIVKSIHLFAKNAKQVMNLGFQASAKTRQRRKKLALSRSRSGVYLHPHHQHPAKMNIGPSPESFMRRR